MYNLDVTVIHVQYNISILGQGEIEMCELYIWRRVGENEGVNMRTNWENR